MSELIHTENVSMFPEVMNIRLAAKYLGVSHDSLYRYINTQKIPAFKIGNRWRFKKSLLDEWMMKLSDNQVCHGS